MTGTLHRRPSRNPALASKGIHVRRKSHKSLRLCASGAVTPAIDRTLPLADARDGFAAMAAGDLFGKLVFTM